MAKPIRRTSTSTPSPTRTINRTNAKTGNPPYNSTFTSTFNPTIAAYLTATPTGPLPTRQTILINGPTSTATYPPTKTLAPGWMATSVADFMPGVPPNLFEANPGLQIVPGSDAIDKGLTLYELQHSISQNTPPGSTLSNYQKAIAAGDIILIIVTIVSLIP
jgi:hypothetical protein